MIDIDYNDLTSGKPLSEDTVQLLVQPGGDPNLITVVLTLQGVTWWKGIQCNNVVLCQCQDSQTTSTASLPAGDVQKDGLQLWKAKTFGVHDQMYDIKNPRSWAQGGKVYTFIWKND